MGKVDVIQTGQPVPVDWAPVERPAILDTFMRERHRLLGLGVPMFGWKVKVNPYDAAVLRRYAAHFFPGQQAIVGETRYGAQWFEDPDVPVGEVKIER
jgi:hypothetical protein